MQNRFTESEKKTLLRLAREAIESAVDPAHHAVKFDLHSLPPALRECKTSFVTLYNGDQLRGCIGGLMAEHALAEDVRIHAAAAATKDFRFLPVRADEIPQLSIEISVLSTPEPLEYEGPDDLIGKLRPGEDGVILQQGVRRATFLPQVWKKVPDPERFLGMLCEKAFLPPDAWKSGKLQVFTYQVLPICEADLKDE
ncbi:MAG: AmmeMemoRadiSam system protein A [Anaerolineales bacterium]